MKQTIIIFALFSLMVSAFVSKPEFSYKVYGNIANYFESEKDLLDFFEFKKGNVVAEIGALKGENMAGFCILTDSIHFYAQDIDPKNMSQKNMDKALAKAEKYKKPITCRTEIVIGNEKESKLPDNSFDKIILSNTFHEFSFMNEMLRDIHKKLKAEGKLYILEVHCGNKSHKNYSAEESLAILQAQGFKLLKRDGKDLNGGTGVYRLILNKE